MIPRRRTRAAASLFLAAVVVAAAGPEGLARQPAKSAITPRTARVAFVPLDERPRSLADVTQLGAVADVQILAPPAALLSRHLKTGDGDGVARWLDDLDLAAVDAVVISTDMLAYGGLIGSRTGRVREPDARRRLEAIDRLKTRRRDLPVFAFTSLLRLQPTDDGGNPGWRQSLTDWATSSAGNAAADAAIRAKKAEDALPAGMLDTYRAVRARDLAITLAMIDRAGAGVVNALVIGDDEPLAEGVQVAERARVAAAIAASGASDRIFLRAGVEESAALLVARAVFTRLAQAPAVRVTYSSDAARDRMKAAVGADLKIVGAREAAAKSAATVSLEVFESGGAAPAEAVARRVLAPRDLVAVADVGESEGGSLGLLETLRSSKAYPRLAGYAAGPTPQAATATAVVQALALASVVDRPAAGRSREALDRVAAAHARLLLSRAIEDVLYHDVIAPQTVEELLASRGVRPDAVPEKERPRVSTYVEKELTPLAQSLVADFGLRPWHLPSRTAKAVGPGIVVKDLAKLAIAFPWGDMNEPELAFELVVEPATTAPRPPAPRILR